MWFFSHSRCIIRSVFCWHWEKFFPSSDSLNESLQSYWIATFPNRGRIAREISSSKYLLKGNPKDCFTGNPKQSSTVSNICNFQVIFIRYNFFCWRYKFKHFCKFSPRSGLGKISSAAIETEPLSKMRTQLNAPLKPPEYHSYVMLKGIQGEAANDAKNRHSFGVYLLFIQFILIQPVFVLFFSSHPFRPILT